VHNTGSISLVEAAYLAQHTTHRVYLHCTRV